jgi:phage head maturation protease
MELPAELRQFFEEGTVSSRRISRSQALQVPAVMRARNLICGTLATLPLRHIGPDMKATPWPLFDQPDPELPTSVMWAYTYEDLLFEGLSWWQVTAFGWHGFPVEARHVPISSVSVSGTPALPSVSQITPDQPFPAGGRVYVDGRPVDDREIIRFDSPNPPLLVQAAQAIRTCLLLDAAAALYAKDPIPIGYFSPEEGVDGPSNDPGSAGDDSDRSEAEAMLDQWETSRRQRAWGYLDGLKPNILQWDPKKLQLAEQRQHAVLEISRATNLDPEYLAVNVATRTYQNSEQRRQDLIDFNLGGYSSAVQDRLSMRDVTMRGYVGRIDFGGFLRGDTKTRMETYEIGLRVGAYTKPEIRQLEDKPPLTDAELRDSQPAPPQPPQQEDPAMASNSPELTIVPSARFSADEADHTVVTFDDTEVAETFRVNPEKRTISGLAVPWGKIARSGFAKWRFAEGSLHWSSEARIKLNMGHDREQTVGKAIRLQSTSRGLDVTFKVGRGDDGDRALQKAEDGVYDGLSIEVDFDEDDDWQVDPADESVRLVRSGTLRGAALTPYPAFDDARVSRVAATRDGRKGDMPEETKEAKPGEGSVALDADEFTKFMGGLSTQIAESHKSLTEELGKSIGESVAAGVKVALENISTPQDGPEPVRAARFTVTREAPIYSFDGAGPCLVRDAWYAQKEHDDDARDRLRKFHQQSDEVQKLAATHVATQAAAQAQFANQPGAQFTTSTTTTGAAVIPPGYRPDLFVPMLEQGRPFVNALSRGTIANATPFVVPVFANLATGTGDHTEGNAPTEGALTFTTKTVTPGAISGKLPLTREIVDSSNPAIDQIALAAMRESYARQTEAKVYALLNGANGAGGVITAGFVPSGAQVAFTGAAPTGAALVKKVREQLALYPFRRFNAPNRALLSQRATTGYATAEDTTGRPLLPSVGAQNAAGLGNAVQVGWFVDGLANVPAWAITGTGDGDGDVFILNSSDAWAWESPILSFRFEEKQGPQIIELALFGYFATHLLRPVGLSVIRASDGVV